VATQKSFAQGDIQATQNQMDIAIQGEGFLQIRRPDGTLAYTRDGALKISADGTLVTSQGYLLEPRISFSQDTTEITIGRDGTIDAKVTGDRDAVPVGQIELAKFINPAGLRSIGGNLYVETTASGPAILGTATEEGFGEVLQGFLESSNVDVVEEMVNMITAQRAYEVSAKTVKTVEDMLTIANNLKRG
jgi:flagellar basal-body rod protein FlgG